MIVQIMEAVLILLDVSVNTRGKICPVEIQHCQLLLLDPKQNPS